MFICCYDLAEDVLNETIEEIKRVILDIDLNNSVVNDNKIGLEDVKRKLDNILDYIYSYNDEVKALEKREEKMEEYFEEQELNENAIKEEQKYINELIKENEELRLKNIELNEELRFVKVQNELLRIQRKQN